MPQDALSSLGENGHPDLDGPRQPGPGRARQNPAELCRKTQSPRPVQEALVNPSNATHRCRTTSIHALFCSGITSQFHLDQFGVAFFGRSIKELHCNFKSFGSGSCYPLLSLLTISLHWLFGLTNPATNSDQPTMQPIIGQSLKIEIGSDLGEKMFAVDQFSPSQATRQGPCAGHHVSSRGRRRGRRQVQGPNHLADDMEIHEKMHEDAAVRGIGLQENGLP